MSGYDGRLDEKGKDPVSLTSGILTNMPWHPPSKMPSEVLASPSPPAVALFDWLEQIKQGYGRFTAGFEALGIEDTSDIVKVNLPIFTEVEMVLRRECEAKSMHIKNIRLALLEAGCDLEIDTRAPGSDPHNRVPSTPTARSGVSKSQPTQAAPANSSSRARQMSALSSSPPATSSASTTKRGSQPTCSARRPGTPPDLGLPLACAVEGTRLSTR